MEKKQYLKYKYNTSSPWSVNVPLQLKQKMLILNENVSNKKILNKLNIKYNLNL